MFRTARLVVAAILACVLATFAVLPGAASAYPAGHTPTIRLDHSSGPVGDKVIVFGEHFTPNKPAPLSFHSTPVALGTVVASAAGTFTTTITVPHVPLGAHEVVAVDISGQSPTAEFTVIASGTGGGGGGLAGTGVAVIGISSVGAILIVGGAVFLLAARRRRSTV